MNTIPLNLIEEANLPEDSNLNGESKNSYLIKVKTRPLNKRYLSAIKNHSKKHTNPSNQDEAPEGSRKKNKQQFVVCKFWYHDSRNCLTKNHVHIDKENV